MAAAFWLLPPARSCRPSVRSPQAPVAQAPVAQAPVALALVERTASLTLLLTLAVVLAGVGSFRMHWLAPAAVFGPVIVCGRLARRGQEVRCRRLAAAIALVVFGIIVYRLGTAWVDKSRHRDRFFDEAARVVVERGWSERHFLTNHLVVGANLRLRCPGISVACTYCPAFRPAPAATAPGLAVWSVVEDRDSWIERDPSSIVVKAAPAEHDPQYRRLVFGLEETACRTIAAGAGVPGRWIVVLPAESY
jgi:hypothetical protein